MHMNMTNTTTMNNDFIFVYNSSSRSHTNELCQSLYPHLRKFQEINEGCAGWSGGASSCNDDVVCYVISDLNFTTDAK